VSLRMEAISKRRSDREFSSQELPLPLLSNLLWAAYGVNRETLRYYELRGLLEQPDRSPGGHRLRKC